MRALHRFGWPSLTPRADTAESHLAWVRTPRKRGGLGHMQIPLLADVTKEISASYGTLLKDAGIALRGLFIIDPAGTLQQVTINNLPGALQGLAQRSGRLSDQARSGPRCRRGAASRARIPVRGGARRGLPCRLDAGRGDHDSDGGWSCELL